MAKPMCAIEAPAFLNLPFNIVLFPPGNVPSGFLVDKIAEYNSSNWGTVNLGISFGLK